MIHNTKCTCGHQNPVGTVLCEACGLPVQQEDKQSNKPLEMRYEGAARRSQKANPKILDRIWNFFSSVKVAVWLIIITLIVAIPGTLIEQVNVIPSINPPAYYANKYGTLGEWYYALGLADTFGSWWFKGLVLMIGASLVICSLDRIIPLYKALKKQKPSKHETFLRRQKVVYEGNVEHPDEWLKLAQEAVKGKRYKITSEGHALLGEKNRFSRWGPYINHCGLIILLAALLTRGIPGWYMEQGISLYEGETVAVPGTNYYLKNIDFTEVKEVGQHVSGQQLQIAYETEAVLFQCVADCDNPLREPVLEEIKRHTIRPNQPLQHGAHSFFQVGYDDHLLQPVITSVTFSVLENGASIGDLSLDLFNPDEAYTIGDKRFELTDYYAELTNINGEPATKSRIPRNPALVFDVTDSSGLAESYFIIPFSLFQTRVSSDDPEAREPLSFEVADMEVSRYSSYVLVRVERALPYVLAGALIFLFGVILGLYWQHRRIWIRIDGNRIIVAAHTNKNWYGLREELAKILKKTGIEVDAKSLENNGVDKS